MKKYKPAMRVTVHGIGGSFAAGASGDELVGTAHDMLTLLRLVEYVELRKGYAISLHGAGPDGIALSGVMTTAETRNLFRIYKLAS